MNVRAIGRRWTAVRAGLLSLVTAMKCLLRNLPMFAASRPKTPLRVLCLVAFDAHARLHGGKRLSTATLHTLAEFLDFAACANAEFDFKTRCPHETGRVRQLLDRRGLAALLDEYFGRLCELERMRPTLGGDFVHFAAVTAYRENIVRLSLGAMRTIAFDDVSLGEAIATTEREEELNLLFRLVMQCQIIDDTLDYRADLAAGLPSFLTASHSFSEALASTRHAAMQYADCRSLPVAPELTCFKLALCFTSLLTHLCLFAGGCRQTIIGSRAPAAVHLRQRTNSSLEQSSPIRNP